MKQIFKMLTKAYQSNDFEIIFDHPYGNYFLKLRSLSRTEILRNLSQTANINIEKIQGRQLFEYLFCRNISEFVIDEFIRKIYQQQRAIRLINEENLYSQLYRLQIFDWGGFYQNAVEQTIINNYVKKFRTITSFSTVLKMIWLRD